MLCEVPTIYVGHCDGIKGIHAITPFWDIAFLFAFFATALVRCQVGCHLVSLFTWKGVMTYSFSNAKLHTFVAQGAMVPVPEYAIFLECWKEVGMARCAQSSSPRGFVPRCAKVCINPTGGFLCARPPPRPREKTCEFVRAQGAHASNFEAFVVSRRLFPGGLLRSCPPFEGKGSGSTLILSWAFGRRRGVLLFKS
jgi:hypothetical protein